MLKKTEILWTVDCKMHARKAYLGRYFRAGRKLSKRFVVVSGELNKAEKIWETRVLLLFPFVKESTESVNWLFCNTRISYHLRVRAIVN